MAIITTNVAAIACDGCDKRLNDGEIFSNAATARGHAFAAGWRFIAKRTAAGEESRRGTSDVCPDCQPTFVPQLDQIRRGR